MSEEKKVSAIVVNWNGMKFLPVCLDSIFRQSYKNLEVIVVDCASKDESVSFIKSNYPLAKVIELKQDSGPPYAINLATREAQGEYILILNNDVYLPENLVAEMAAELEKDENCVINPLQLDFDGNFIGAGYPARDFGLQNLFKPEELRPFFSCTACCLVTKQVIERNTLNELFFLYEDVEWGWRLNLKNVPPKPLLNSYFLHKNAGSVIKGSPKQEKMAIYSFLATHYICFKVSTSVLLLPVTVLTLLKKLLLLCKRDPVLANSFFSGFFQFVKHLPKLSQYKRRVQNERFIKSDLWVLKTMIGSSSYLKELKNYWQTNLRSLMEKEIQAHISYLNRDFQR
ncbi:MAG: glycosyltransferase [candidate division Zixibacteria bacterium]|nr:glycosyltransferase [candidate division Zixibacteria bacterium]